MGLFGGGDIGALLAQLVSSPRVQYGVQQFKNTLPLASGPFRTQAPSGIGAAPRLGNQYSSQGGQAGSAFGGSIGSVLSKLGGQQQQQQDPMMALYAQLIQQLQSPVNAPTGVDTEDLMRQIHAAIDPIYDQRSQAAQNQSARGRKEVQGMYGALADDYERLAPEQAKQAAAAQQQVSQLYGQLRSNIEGNYSRVSEEQGELFKSLGIESALPSVLEDQAPAVTDAMTAASENQTQQQQRYMDIGNMDETYYREGSPIATMTGNEISTSMLAQLQDYLQQIEAERTSGIQGAYSEQLGQANSLLAQQQQAAQSETARRQEMLFSMLQSQLKGGGQAQALNPDSFMSQLPPQTQQSVAGAFTQLQRSPEAVYGKVEDPRNPVPGSFVSTTPEWYMQQADKMYQQGQIDASTHAALLQYIQLMLSQQQ
jgi:hypothetical protein